MTALSFLIVFAAIQDSSAARTSVHNHVMNENDENLQFSKDLCDHSLMVQYNSMNEATGVPLTGTFFALENEWSDKQILQKKMTNGCTKYYNAKCKEGAIQVIKTCPGIDSEVSTRCLGGFGCFATSRTSDIKHGETAELIPPEVSDIKLDNGVVKFKAIRTGKCKPIATQKNFDVKAYIAKPWYVQQEMEIQYLPKAWNYCIAARYTMQDKDTFWGYMVQVRNLAREKDGTVHDSGSLICAYSADKLDPAKLGVAPCFLPTGATGDYWVVSYNEEEGYALVSGGQPTYETANGCTTGEGINGAGLWLFTRQRERNETLVQKMRGIATANGFDLGVLNDVDQTDCEGFLEPYLEDEDTKFCSSAVSGGIIRQSSWRHQKKCKCPASSVVGGPDLACHLKGRYYSPVELGGKGCYCTKD